MFEHITTERPPITLVAERVFEGMLRRARSETSRTILTPKEISLAITRTLDTLVTQGDISSEERVGIQKQLENCPQSRQHEEKRAA